MFFRRVFSRKELSGAGAATTADPIMPTSTLPPTPPAHHHLVRRSSSSDEKQQQSNGLSVVLQLTPLWEHIIRTKSLPANLNEAEMFDEFRERLLDPEWQVRQHALRVLVDVLIVMKQRSEQYFQPLIRPLVENFGHAAPAIRKGALDVLKVYMAETKMPLSVLLDIIDIGMDQTLNEAIYGRLCAGVMLSLPALVQPTLNSSVKRHQLLTAAIAALCRKMVQVTYQEVALNVLIRLRQMVGAREFAEHIAHADHREFELLCNVYGLPRSEAGSGDAADDDATINNLYISTSAGGNRKWQVLGSAATARNTSAFNSIKWRNMTERKNDDDGDHLIIRPNGRRSATAIDSDEKVILETEINIDNTPVTMRILEQNSTESSYDNNTDDLPNGGNSDDDDGEVGPAHEHCGIVRVLTDSEFENMNTNYRTDLDFVPRTPRRVTFGGEIVKMRTPDSDSCVTQSDVDAGAVADGADNDNQQQQQQRSLNQFQQSLHIDIPADVATTRMESPKTASSATRRQRRPSVSPSEEIISATKPHKQIEVLHNLQRSPLISPDRNSRRNSMDGDVADVESKVNEPPPPAEKKMAEQQVQQWEDLSIVSDEVVQNLRNGVGLKKKCF